MKSIEVAASTLYGDVGRLAGWSFDGTGQVLLRNGGVGGDVVGVMDAAQPTVTLVRNVDVSGGVYVDAGTITNAVLYYD